MSRRSFGPGGRAARASSRSASITSWRLLPFEVPFFAKYGIACTYVGHPAIDAGAERGDGRGFRTRHGICRLTRRCSASFPAAAPAKCAACCRSSARRSRLLERTTPRPSYRHSRGAIAEAEVVRDMTRDWPLPVLLLIDLSGRFDAFAASDAAMAKSGTVSLELALAGVPMVVAYRVSPATGLSCPPLGDQRRACLAREPARGARESCRSSSRRTARRRISPRPSKILLKPRRSPREAQRAGFREVIEVLGDPRAAAERARRERRARPIVAPRQRPKSELTCSPAPAVRTEMRASPGGDDLRCSR